jgi:hypothetical protein
MKSERNDPGAGSMRAEAIFERRRAAAPFPLRLTNSDSKPLPAFGQFQIFRERALGIQQVKVHRHI